MKPSLSLSAALLLVAFTFVTPAPAQEKSSDPPEAKTQSNAPQKANGAAADDSDTSDSKPLTESSTKENAEDQAGAENKADADELLEGHSIHGEVFNEGPRQAAYLMSGTGQIDFEVTTKSEQARQFVLQGIGQLHGFWYFESERSFRQAAALDEQCAIAYWGMAMSNRKNSDRAKGFIKEAMDRRSNASKYERLWIEAFDKYINKEAKSDDDKRKRANDYVASVEDILFEFPEDVEAKAFLAEFLWSAQREKLPIVSYHAIDAMIQDVLAVRPDHPIHHYRIHLWDRKKPELALQSAAMCGSSAPSIAHMWHMPGHIYSRLHRYHEAVFQQEASARVDHAHMQRDMVLPDQIHNFAHNNEWCIRNLLHVGRVNDALALARNMFELPRHPKYNTVKKSGSFKYGRERLMLALSTYQLFEETARLSTTPYLQPVDDQKLDLKRDRLVASALVMTGQTEKAATLRAEIQARLDELQSKKTTAEEKAKQEAEKNEKANKEIDKAISKAGASFKKDIKELTNALNEIDGRTAYIKEDYEEAVKLFAKADGISTEDVVDAMLLAGQEKEAIKKIEGFVRSNQNEVRPLACLVDAYWRTGDQEKAIESFHKLRKLSAHFDLEVPAFAALRPIADELKLADDWRQPLEIADSFGTRPALDDLGPFRWSPPEAAEFKLLDADGSVRTLEDFQGKPVVVIFYLGHGCLHCAEQLQKFSPMASKFEEAGLELIAISTDPQETLSRAYDDLDEKFPFPLVADPDLEVFKRYRCYDDFENQTLHGTFVIDADRRIRWMDISYEPFMDPEFVLDEAVRLLEQDKVTSQRPALTESNKNVLSDTAVE